MNIRADSGEILFTHRSFASITGTVASLVSAIILAAGAAAAIFLVAEKQLLGSVAAITLTVIFSLFVAMMVPKISVTIYLGSKPALSLWQRSVFPSSSWIIATPEGLPIAGLRKGFFSRLGRHRWIIVQDGRAVGDALELGIVRAIVRKFLGKFSRTFETDIDIEVGGLPAGRILRRMSDQSAIDVLEIEGDVLDPRVAIGIGAVILGREP